MEAAAETAAARAAGAAQEEKNARRSYGAKDTFGGAHVVGLEKNLTVRVFTRGFEYITLAHSPFLFLAVHRQAGRRRRKIGSEEMNLLWRQGQQTHRRRAFLLESAFFRAEKRAEGRSHFGSNSGSCNF